MKKLNTKAIIAIAAAFALLLCAAPAAVNAITANRQTASVASGVSVESGADEVTVVSVSVPASGTVITFTDSGITAAGSGTGYEISGTELTISEAGTYTVTGSCAEGSIKVKKDTEGTVELILEDLTLSSSTGAALSCNKNTDVVVYAVGTVTLTDAEDIANEESDDFDGAAVKVKSGASLTITGNGTLNVDGSGCKNGVKGAAGSVITVEGALTLNIAAANNGLACDNAVVIKSGVVNINAGGDGIKAEPDGDDAESAGSVTISGGQVTVEAGDDAIQSTGDTVISGGILALTSGDDAVHADANVVIDGGVITIDAGDDAVHAEHDVTVNGGTIDVTACCEGFEGATVTLNDGSGSIVASDDGINAATDAAVDTIGIYINGGTWTVDADGDGLDAGGDSTANRGGDIEINGGVTLVFGAANSGNGGLDYDGSCVYTGGTLLVVDPGGMNMTPGSGTYVFFGSGAMGGMGGFGGMNGQTGGATITRGSVIEVKDSEGNTLITATGTKNANCVLLCDGSVAEGEAYTLYVDGEAAATATATSGGGAMGMMGGPGGMTGGFGGPMDGQGMNGSRQKPPQGGRMMDGGFDGGAGTP